MVLPYGSSSNLAPGRQKRWLNGVALTYVKPAPTMGGLKIRKSLAKIGHGQIPPLGHRAGLHAC
jgi:hypothetical protein